MPAWKTRIVGSAGKAYPSMAMLGRSSYLNDIRFKINRLLANQYDIDNEADWVKPGNTPVQKAFQQSKYGLELLFRFTEPDQFPSPDKTSRRLGAKLIKRHLLFSGAVHGTFFAMALAELLARTEGRLHYDEPVPDGELGSPMYYRRFRETTQDFYPAEERTLYLLDNRAPAEFRVLETGEPRESVRSGEEAGTGYSAALLRGENPSGNPALVKEQWEYARDYFIWSCEKAMMPSAMERPTRAQEHVTHVTGVIADLVDLPSPEAGGPGEDPKRITYRARALERWEASARSYLSYVALDATVEGEVSARMERA
jgi:hypothetical protein